MTIVIIYCPIFVFARMRVSKKSGFVIIKQVRQSDSGTYVCIAKNAAGSTSIPVNLQVNG